VPQSFGVYLFIVFSNGLRYGHRYLYLGYFLSVAGLTVVGTTTPWWQSQPTVLFGWLIGLGVLPFYVSVLVQSINAARAKAEQALKVCTEQLSRASCPAPSARRNDAAAGQN